MHYNAVTTALEAEMPIKHQILSFWCWVHTYVDEWCQSQVVVSTTKIKYSHIDMFGGISEATRGQEGSMGHTPVQFLQLL